MVVFSLTVALLLSLAGVFYWILHFIVEDPLLKEMAVIPFVAMHHISEYFEQIIKRRTLRDQSGTVSYSNYMIPWQLMLLYGTATLFAWCFGFFSLYDFAVASAAIPVESEFSGLYSISTMVMVVANSCGAFFVGRWIGTRCASYAHVVLPLCFLGNVILGFATNSLLVPEGTIINTYGSYLNLFALKAVDIVGFYPIGLLGFWHGRRTQQGKYIMYLLGLMPASARATLVDLACDEANRLPAPSSPAPPASSGEAVAARTM
jgi:hypothetical protein